MLAKLKSLQGKSMLRYLTVAQRINECHRDIDHYIMHYTVSDSSNEISTLLCSSNTIPQMLGLMHVENSLQCIEAKLEMFLPHASTLQLKRGAITGIVLIDAAGKRYEVPMDCAKTARVMSCRLWLLNGRRGAT
jgi:hypothetical protein